MPAGRGGARTAGAGARTAPPRRQPASQPATHLEEGCEPAGGDGHAVCNGAEGSGGALHKGGGSQQVQSKEAGGRRLRLRRRPASWQYSQQYSQQYLTCLATMGQPNLSQASSQGKREGGML